MQTGDIIDSFEKQILNGEELSQWCEQLLIDGFDTNEIRMTAASPESYWEEIHRWFVTICRQIEISEDITKDLAATKQRVMIEEYMAGHRRAADLLFRFEELRLKTGFPESIIFRLLPDSKKGKNPSGFYGDSSGLTGEKLEEAIRPYLETVNIYRA